MTFVRTPFVLGIVPWRQMGVPSASNARKARGQRFGTRRADVLLRVCPHAQYTAALAVNILRQAGAGELPDVMLISLARQESEVTR
jgi:hypothetical protein